MGDDDFLRISVVHHPQPPCSPPLEHSRTNQELFYLSVSLSLSPQTTVLCTNKQQVYCSFKNLHGRNRILRAEKVAARSLHLYSPRVMYIYVPADLFHLLEITRPFLPKTADKTNTRGMFLFPVEIRGFLSVYRECGIDIGCPFVESADNVACIRYSMFL